MNLSDYAVRRVTHRRSDYGSGEEVSQVSDEVDYFLKYG
jgi:hypothetical protein